MREELRLALLSIEVKVDLSGVDFGSTSLVMMAAYCFSARIAPCRKSAPELAEVGSGENAEE